MGEILSCGPLATLDAGHARNTSSVHHDGDARYPSQDWHGCACHKYFGWKPNRVCMLRFALAGMLIESRKACGHCTQMR